MHQTEIVAYFVRDDIGIIRKSECRIRMPGLWGTYAIRPLRIAHRIVSIPSAAIADGSHYVRAVSWHIRIMRAPVNRHGVFKRIRIASHIIRIALRPKLDPSEMPCYMYLILINRTGCCEKRCDISKHGIRVVARGVIKATIGFDGNIDLKQLRMRNPSERLHVFRTVFTQKFLDRFGGIRLRDVASDAIQRMEWPGS